MMEYLIGGIVLWLALWGIIAFMARNTPPLTREERARLNRPWPIEPRGDDR